MWNEHISVVIKKASKRLYCLVPLKKSRVPRLICPPFTLLVYALFLRTQYLLFFYALPKYLKDELVRVEKRAMSIICPGLPYQETIELVNIVPIVDFITGQCSNTFDAIIKDPEHRLNRLKQFSGPSRYALRCNRHLIVPKCKTDRFRNSFVIRSCIDNI